MKNNEKSMDCEKWVRESMKNIHQPFEKCEQAQQKDPNHCENLFSFEGAN